MEVTSPVRNRRNAGPEWGFRFLRAADRRLPYALFRPFLALGSGIACIAMPKQRRAVAEFQQALTGRKPSLLRTWHPFFAFTESLLELLRLSQHGKHEFRFSKSPENRAFEALARSQRPALFGTFHVGNSDLLGYALHNFDRRVQMIRVKMENSEEIGWLSEQFSRNIGFIWVDHPQNLLFEIKGAIESGQSLAMKCDRLEQSGRLEAFRFCGKKRLFPFSIYHFSLLFDMPVVFATAWPRGKGSSEVSASTIFEPDSDADRNTNLIRARKHFQTVLDQLETQLRKTPELWFNFEPLNPEKIDTKEPAISNQLH